MSYAIHQYEESQRELHQAYNTNTLNTKNIREMKSSKGASRSKRNSQYEDDDDDDESYDQYNYNSKSDNYRDNEDNHYQHETAVNIDTNDETEEEEMDVEDQIAEIEDRIENNMLVASKSLMICSKILKETKNHPSTEHIIDEKLDANLQESYNNSQVAINEIDRYLQCLNDVVQQNPNLSKADKAEIKVTKARLTKDYFDVAKRSKQIHKLIEERQQQQLRLQQQEEEEQQYGKHYQNTPPSDDEKVELLDNPKEYSYQQYAEMEAQSNINHQDAQKRLDFMLEIEKDVTHVHDMMRDLGEMVQEQGHVIDSIESNISASRLKAKVGADELTKAENYQKKRRKKMCWLVLLLALGALVITLTLYVIL